MACTCALTYSQHTERKSEKKNIEFYANFHNKHDYANSIITIQWPTHICTYVYEYITQYHSMQSTISFNQKIPSKKVILDTVLLISIIFPNKHNEMFTNSLTN